MKKLVSLLGIGFLMLMPILAKAQCAMCRTQVENNVSHGDTALAAGLNLGILYLFFAPYIILSVIGYLWYKNAKVRPEKRPISERLKSSDQY